MKKVMFLAILSLVFILSSCSNDELSTKPDDYTFTTTITVDCSPNVTGYPQITTTVTTQKGITEVQAKQVAAGLTSTSTSTSGGYKITTTMQCVYILTKNYVAPKGTSIGDGY